MVWLRRLAWGVGILVVLAVAVVAYLLATFDPNRYKDVLIDKVRTDYQRTLVLQGPISLGLWPSLHVKLSQVRLSEHQREQAFASAEGLELSVQALPLLQRQLRVNRVQAHGVSLRYARDAQGRSNIDDLLKPDDEPRPEDDQPGEPVAFEVAGIALKDVALDVDDRKTGVQGKVVLQSFDSGRLADGLQTDIQLKAQAVLSKPSPASIGVRGSLSLTPQLAQNTVLIDKLALDVEGDALGARQVKATLKADALRWDAAKGAAQAQGLSIDGGAQVVGLVVENARLSLERFEYDPAAQSLQLYKLATKVAARQGGQPLNAELNWSELAVKGDEIRGSTLEGNVSLAGPTAVDATFKSDAPSGGFQRFKVPALALDFTVRMAGDGGTREIKGRTQADLDVQAPAREVALQGFTLQATVQEPSLPALQIQATGQAAVQGEVEGKTGGQASWSLKGQLNANPFDTKGTAKMGVGVPKVQAVASFTSLDLNRLLPASGASAKPGVAAKPASGADAGPAQIAKSASSRSSGDTPVDLSVLSLVDGRFELSAGQLAVRQYRVSDARLLATIEQGRLTLQNLSGGAWGGRLQAQGNAQAGANQKLALRGTAENVDINALLKDVAGKDVLEGRGQLKWDVNTGGRTMPQLTSGLDGTASLLLRDGAVKGINLAKSLRDAKARLGGLGGKSDEVQRSSQVEKTDFTELSASFQIKDGVARNKDLSAKSPFLRLGGEGSVDLVRQRVDYTVNTTVTGTVKGQGGAEIDALKGLTVPVKLAGPFDALDWKIQWSGVAVGSLQNTLKGRLEDELKAKLLGKSAEPAASGASAPKPSREEQLKNKLRGLFK
ncbi:MAG: AsmA family protein [Pseudomonadota bacterium]